MIKTKVNNTQKTVKKIMAKTNTSTALPSGYQEVEYIQTASTTSGGNAYLNTGFYPDQNTSIEIKFRAISGMEGWLFGADNSNSSKRYGFKLVKQSSSVSTINRYIAAYGTNSLTDFSAGKTLSTSDTTLVMDKNKIYIDGALKRTLTEQTFTSTSYLYLFRANTGGSTASDRYGYGRIYYCKIWDNGKLIRHLIPCYRKSDNALGMYDLVNNLFRDCSNSDYFTKGADVNPIMKEVKYIKTKVNNAMVTVYGGVPSIYQKVNYIESSGSQYIITGVYGSGSMKIETKLALPTNNYTGTYLCAFGARDYSTNSWSSGGRFLCFYYRISNSKYDFNQNYYDDPNNLVASAYASITNDPMDVVLDKGSVYIDGNLVSAMSTTTVSFDTSLHSVPIALFNNYIWDFDLSKYTIQNRGQKVRIYSFKMYDDNGALIRDFVPCYRKSDNVIGMFELVDKIFYTNDGTGTFSKGTDI